MARSTLQDGFSTGVGKHPIVRILWALSGTRTLLAWNIMERNKPEKMISPYLRTSTSINFGICFGVKTSGSQGFKNYSLEGILCWLHPQNPRQSAKRDHAMAQPVCVAFQVVICIYKYNYIHYCIAYLTRVPPVSTWRIILKSGTGTAQVRCIAAAGLREKQWGQRVRWTDFGKWRQAVLSLFGHPWFIDNHMMLETHNWWEGHVYLQWSNGSEWDVPATHRAIGIFSCHRDASTNQHSGIVVTIVVHADHAGSQNPPSPRSTSWSTMEGATPPIPISRRFSQ